MLAAGHAIGGWCAIPSTLTAEVMALAGYDFIVIDTQHGLIDYPLMCAMILALERRNVRSIVRVPWNDPAVIMRALDAGANGVLVPMIEGPHDAQRAAGACLYPPTGYRSWGPIRAALGDASYTPERANTEVACIPMIETATAVADLCAIIETPGIAGVFIGPWDLSLATTGGLDDVGHKSSDHEIFAAVLDACEERGIPAGVACASPDDARRRLEEGFRFPAVASDFALLGQAAVTTVEATRASLGRVGGSR